jgi:hypothetical protein
MKSFAGIELSARNLRLRSAEIIQRLVSIQLLLTMAVAAAETFRGTVKRTRQV